MERQMVPGAGLPRPEESPVQTGDAAAMPLQLIGKEEIRKAGEILQKYRMGKQKLDARIIECEKWWRMRHWEVMEAKGNPYDLKNASGWLFNVIISKHADGIQALPEANVLPREEGDLQAARELADVIPCILEQNEFSEVYSQALLKKMIQGTGTYGVFWDPEALGGLGDIRLRAVNTLCLYWEPGITDIQDSRNVFYVTMVDDEVLEEQYPNLKGKLGNSQDKPEQYMTEDNIDLTGKSAVVEWYYHRQRRGKKVLHYCKYVGDELLYSSENEGLEEGFYAHGQYPFHLDALFPVEGSPCGFGYIDVGKDAQSEIDMLNQALVQNAMINGAPRYYEGKGAKINRAQFMDIRNKIVEVDGQLTDMNLKPIDAPTFPGNVVNYMQLKIDELKQVTGNTDASNGVASSSNQTASGIIALQEASGKVSRASSMGSHRVFKGAVWQMIELIRQFYNIPRMFRITGRNGKEEFREVSNAALKSKPVQVPGIGEVMRSPVFDLKIEVQTKSQYAKNAANEQALAFYSAGIFNPANVDQALIMLDMMDFEGKDRLVEQLGRQATLQQQLVQWQQMTLALAQKYDPALAEGLAANIMGQPVSRPQMAQIPQGGDGASDGGAGSKMKAVREQTQAASQPVA